MRMALLFVVPEAICADGWPTFAVPRGWGTPRRSRTSPWGRAGCMVARL